MRQHPERRHQNPLRLFDAHWPSTPTLAHRPLADGTLQPDDAPDARSSRTAEATQRIECRADATEGVDLRIGPRAKRGSPELCVNLGDDGLREAAYRGG